MMTHNLPIVPVVNENGMTRICESYKTTLNLALDTERYPLQRMENFSAFWKCSLLQNWSKQGLPAARRV